jgi:hypothetical protein
MRLRAGLLYRAPSDVATGDIAREKPLFGPVQTPPIAQDFQQLCREHHIAILLAFALFDSDHHALAINIRGFKTDCFRDAQPSGVAGRQDGAMFETLYAGQKLQDFFRTQNNGQLLGLLGRRDDFFHGPIPMKSDFVQETKSSYGDKDGTGSQFLFVCQVDLVRANLLRTQ